LRASFRFFSVKEGTKFMRHAALSGKTGMAGSSPGRRARSADQVRLRPFLAGEAFEPETIREMSLLLEQVCDALSLKLVDDAATRLIAGKIVALAQRGVRDVSTLTSMTLKEFQHSD